MSSTAWTNRKAQRTAIDPAPLTPVTALADPCEKMWIKPARQD